MAKTIDLVVAPDLADDASLRREAARHLGVEPDRVTGLATKRRGIDARRGRVRVRVRLEVYVDEPFEPRPTPNLPDLPPLTGEPEVVIVGAGPAGLFAAWALAMGGRRSVIIERGRPIRQRRRDIARLNRCGHLAAESNYCFGEGGAGTFSDGKLYTRAHRRGPVEEVLTILVGCGAPGRILWDTRPHIGTNRLPQVVSGLRDRLETAGVGFHFGARAADLCVEGGQVVGVELEDGQPIRARATVVAAGHSAHDVYDLLHRRGVAMAAKPFAMGVRIEHPQGLIDDIQYGALAGHPELGAAAYSLTRTIDGIGVYSFCMCPGGFVVAAATDADGLVLNGMSPAKRGTRYANAGLVVTIGPPDYGDGPLDGLAFRQRIERAAYSAGGGGFRAPAQRLTDYLANRASASLPKTSYPRGLTSTDLRAVLTPRLALPLAEALRWFGRHRMRGYVTHEAVMLGVETRTSAPLRVLRDPRGFESPSHPGLYPAGEGAGHAGGIVSAALDGLNVGRAISVTLGDKKI